MVNGKKEKDTLDMVLPYRRTDGTAIAVQAIGPRGLLSRRTVSLGLGEEREAWDWIGKANDAELADLRFIGISKEAEPGRMASLQKAARVNPDLWWSVENSGVAAQVLAHCEPRRLMLSGSTETAKALESARLDRIESLLLGDVQMKLDVLGRLPNLRRLWLSEWKTASTGPLHLVNMKSLRDAGVLARLGRFEILSLGGCEDLHDLSPLKRLKRLKSLAFPQTVLQEKFEEILSDHPGLRHVELIKCGDVRNLSLLLKLRKLERLVLIETSASSLTHNFVRHHGIGAGRGQCPMGVGSPCGASIFALDA
ncbi:MAG: hypothetical protein HY748_02270 [Elusimicrobia bacterium]|nr:hypothetical protein [Elusimicrobiota bacterium]